MIAGVSALGITGAALVATTSLLSTAGAATSWPTENGSKPVSKTIPVSGTYDGKLARFHGTGDLGGSGQDEGQDPIFELADGAVLKNVIIGSPAADGVHCKGSCTLQNVWWLDVGEDAATFKGKSIVGINSNYGDTAALRKIRIHGDSGRKIKTCTRFEGNSSGKEPKELGSGPDGTSCKFSSSDITYQ